MARAFPGTSQGFAETTAPYNFILSDEVNREKFERASRDAGLYPVFMGVRDLIEFEYARQNASDNAKLITDEKLFYSMGLFLPTSLKERASRYHSAVFTDDWSATIRLEDNDREFFARVGSPSSYISMTRIKLTTHNPIFAYVNLGLPEKGQVKKHAHGQYYYPQSEQTYREFLYKVKADLLLTMFVRGGAPLAK